MPDLEGKLRQSLRKFKSLMAPVIENVNLYTAANLLERDDEDVDVRIWESFLEEKKQYFEDSLQTLEKASDKVFAVLDKSPGKCCTP